jgi:hypothetical protein
VAVANQCDYYLAQSRLPFAGRGVFAGRDFGFEEIIEDSPVIAIRAIYMRNWYWQF